MRMIQIDEEKQTLCSTGSHQASNPSNRQQTSDCGRVKSVQQVLLIVVIINTFIGQDPDFSSRPSHYRSSVSIQRCNAALFHQTFTWHEDPDL